MRSKSLGAVFARDTPVVLALSRGSNNITFVACIRWTSYRAGDAIPFGTGL